MGTYRFVGVKSAVFQVTNTKIAGGLAVCISHSYVLASIVSCYHQEEHGMLYLATLITQTIHKLAVL